MARSKEEIQKNVIETIRENDPTIDVEKGPVYDVVVRPFPNELEVSEEEMERIANLLSVNFVKVSTTEEVNALGNNFKIPRGEGQREQHIQAFYVFTRPIRDIVIPEGTQVSNSDNSLVYETIEEATLTTENAEAFFNSAANRYQIEVTVEAIAEGEDYNLPKGRVINIVSNLDNMDGTISITDSIVEGSGDQSDTDYVETIEGKFLGLDRGQTAGIEDYIRENVTDLLDISVVQANDRSLFRRTIDKPALDIYVIGSRESQKTDTIITEQVTSEFILQNKPVVSVESVTVDSSPVEFEFIQDLSPEVGKSGQSNDKVILINPVNVNRVVSIKYNINQSVVDAQSLFSEYDSPYGTDILVREAFEKEVTFKVRAKIVSTSSEADKIQAEADIREVLYDLPKEFHVKIFPEDTKNKLQEEVVGLMDVHLIKHQSSIDNKFDVEVISFDLNEIPVIDEDSLKIIITV